MFWRRLGYSNKDKLDKGVAIKELKEGGSTSVLYPKYLPIQEETPIINYIN